MAKMSEKSDNKKDIKIEGAENVEREELNQEKEKAGVAEENAEEAEEGEKVTEDSSDGTEEKSEAGTDSAEGNGKKTAKEEETGEEEESDGEEEAEEEEAAKEPTAEEKLAELQDRYMRLSAEYDNFRKRTLKEKMELQKSANENLLNALLPVADDFDRAMQSLEDAQDLKAVKEGMKLIYGKFNGFLDQQGVKEIEAVNKAFDTDLHEAITKIPAPSKKLRGKVVDVIQKGYYLKDRVLRYAKVVIGE